MGFVAYNGFNIEKIIQVLAYIQRRIEKEDSYDKLKLLKLLFLADRCHLREYVSLISHDKYYAFRNGPTASKTLNVINHYTDLIDCTEEELELLNKVEILDNNNRIIKENNTDCMSEVEMRVIERICNTFGEFDNKALIEITHDYPEWKRYKRFFLNGYSLDDELIIKTDDFFKNPDIYESPALKKYFEGKDPLYIEDDILKDVKELYNEQERFNITK
jgi:uncharacterized phage-associated protein